MAQQEDRQDLSGPDDGKCLHYYFYFVDEELGLGYVRVPTWLPCRLQVYFNGHGWLAGVLRKRRIDFQWLTMPSRKSPTGSARSSIADGWEIKRIHHRLDELARRFCPILSGLRRGLSLERGPVRICHRCRFPASRRICRPSMET